MTKITDTQKQAAARLLHKASEIPDESWSRELVDAQTSPDRVIHLLKVALDSSEKRWGSMDEREAAQAWLSQLTGVAPKRLGLYPRVVAQGLLRETLGASASLNFQSHCDWLEYPQAAALLRTAIDKAPATKAYDEICRKAEELIGQLEGTQAARAMA